MIHAYNKEYVSDAMENLGEAFDYAVHAQNLDLNRFSSLFVNASASKSIENGNPKYVSGMSGTELALTVLSQNGIESKPVLYFWHCARFLLAMCVIFAHNFFEKII